MDKAIQLSIPLPRSLDSRIYIHLTVRQKSVQLFITTASAEQLSGAPPLGSFVYALPNKFNPSEPLSTPLYTVEPTLEFTSRLAKLLARKTQLPVYVGNSVSFASAGLGGTVEEEMVAFRSVVEAIMPRLQGAIKSPEMALNGVSSS